MATGTGKTVVMAMLIAWQTLNKVQSPRDARFTKRFLVVTPGITIRDRLRVLFPGDEGNYYDERDLIPPDLKGALNQAQIIITNYHSFLLRDAKEIKGVAANTRKILTAGKTVDPFKETPDDDRRRGSCATLVPGAAKGRRDRRAQRRGPPLLPGQAGPGGRRSQVGGPEQGGEERNEAARVWFRGIQAIVKQVGIKAVYDLSATPFYLGGSGYNEGYIFPWTVSDFSLMDAIESGIVKIPAHPGRRRRRRRPGHLPSASGTTSGTSCPRRRSPRPRAPRAGSLHRSSRAHSTACTAPTSGRSPTGSSISPPLGEPPPVFIVVCPNTVVSKLVYDWIAGEVQLARTADDRSASGQPRLFSNVDDGLWADRPRTILIDSAQLESGEALRDDFRTAAAGEIEAFKAEYRAATPAPTSTSSPTRTCCAR